MIWLAAAAIVLVAVQAASYFTFWPLDLPRINRLSRESLAAESVEFLAASYEIPRHTVKLIGEGYDRRKRQTWALTQAPYMLGFCCDLTIRPDGGDIRHEHYCNVAA